MRLEKIKTQGLAHLSYFLSADGEAAVIDPRRDIDIYLDLAREEGSVIKHVFETHRNEDLLSGAPVLKEETGAKVWHGPNPEKPIQYAAETREGDTFEIGGALLKVLETRALRKARLACSRAMPCSLAMSGARTSIPTANAKSPACSMTAWRN